MTLTKAQIVEACACLEKFPREDAKSRKERTFHGFRVSLRDMKCCLAKGHRAFPLKFEIEGWTRENVRRPVDITCRAFLEFPHAC